MASLISTLCMFFFFLFNISLTPVLGEVIFEDGYSVSTVIDGNKLKINTHSIIPVSGDTNFIVLDSSASTFYTLSYNKDSDLSIRKLTGTGIGYVDGSLDKAKFNKPKSFAVDSKGNIYVADIKNKHAIRKISKSGVTTIAGGNSLKPGRADGPGLNASFSDDFELSFVPERCTIMISDHGSRSKSSFYMVLNRGASLLGLLDSRTGSQQSSSAQHDMEALPNQSGETSSDVLLRHQKRSSHQISRKQPAPLLNFDDCVSSKESANSPVVANSLEDLMTFDGSLDNSELTTNQDDAVKESTDVSVVDSMILANIKGFAEQGNSYSGPEVSQSILSLVNQKKKVV
ncbi:hypothetical protein RND71_023835 [Anisodus tanguticus]|uniref:Uncharacterized protein n=1 Tax=Anisodus tanguticus TaxID=243964 RepID=A0AAE1VF61_9SOLA|nr:hypothetical protein RND71_023835 [Anisodus tanguticus]